MVTNLKNSISKGNFHEKSDSQRETGIIEAGQ